MHVRSVEGEERVTPLELFFDLVLFLRPHPGHGVPRREPEWGRTGALLLAVNDEGFANYRYTIPGDHVTVGILGNSADLLAIENFAWKGNEDMPGMPRHWFGGID